MGMNTRLRVQYEIAFPEAAVYVCDGMATQEVVRVLLPKGRNGGEQRGEDARLMEDICQAYKRRMRNI